MIREVSIHLVLYSLLMQIAYWVILLLSKICSLQLEIEDIRMTKKWYRERCVPSHSFLVFSIYL